MQKFGIFIKSKKFNWSLNKIIYSILFGLIALYLLTIKLFQLDHTILDKIFQWVFISSFIVGLISKFINLPKVEKEPGIIDGYIIFDKDGINIRDVRYKLDDIKAIKISNEDYLGKLTHLSSGHFGGALSDGINNHIIIFFISGKTEKYQFQLLKSDDFQKVRDILISYHQKGKIDFWELANVLGDKNSRDVAQLKSEIDEISTAANTR